MVRTRVIQVLFGESIGKTTRYVKISFLMSVCVLAISKMTTTSFWPISDEISTLGFILVLLMVSAIISTKNDGVLISIFIPSLFTFSLVAGGYGVGWTYNPTIIEEYLLTPLRFSIIGFPIGIIGYLLGRAVESR